MENAIANFDYNSVNFEQKEFGPEFEVYEPFVSEKLKKENLEQTMKDWNNPELAYQFKRKKTKMIHTMFKNKFQKRALAKKGKLVQ